MEFRIDLSDLPICEALYERMAFIDGLAKHQCFALVNARAYFSAEELKKLYAMARYRKLTLLMSAPDFSYDKVPFLKGVNSVLFLIDDFVTASENKEPPEEVSIPANTIEGLPAPMG